jgi:hypothetical protein
MFRNMGSSDTTLAIWGCDIGVRLYTVATGGSPAYSPYAGLPCALSQLPFLLRPGEEKPYIFTLYDGEVAPYVPPNRYYIRLVPPNHPNVDLVAAVIER